MQRCNTVRNALANYRALHFLPGSIQRQPTIYGFSSTAHPESEPDYEAARKWYASYVQTPLPRVGDVTYSRSSGPGGQNVNKVNSKAQLKVLLEDLKPLVSPILYNGLKSSRYYAEKSSSLVFQSDESRKQAANKDICYRRLNDLILEIYHDTVPGETSEEQKEKVKSLKKAENESRLKLKKHISSKKAARRGSND